MISLKSLSEAAGISYKNMKDQRSLDRLPKLEDAYAIATVLGVSVEYLLTGKNKFVIPAAIQDIITRLSRASEDELNMIRRLLGLPIRGTVSKIEEKA
ncbi:MAG: XRE family transcriptional regulator [Spirochaetia bacterium]|nr:XRE family transcriptional regulator [Spirochaetia bacterium]